MNKKIAGIVALGTTAALGLGINAAAGAGSTSDAAPGRSAQSAAPGAVPSSPTAGTAASPTTRGPGGRKDTVAKELASKLEVDQGKVTAALRAVRADLRAARRNGQAARPTVDTVANALAQKLGVSPVKVKTALQQVRASARAAARARHQKALGARLDRAVKDGRLTRAEADAVLKAAKEGILGSDGGHLPKARGHMSARPATPQRPGGAAAPSATVSG